MRMMDIIEKKRDHKALTQEEIAFFIHGYVNQSIPDYQVSALLMAIYLNGMSTEETVFLTEAIVASGDVLDLSAIEGIKVDKHSTGGVGDKTTLVLAPLVASLGVKVAKLSGRGLGHTGGTIDKLESFEGFNTSLSNETFIEQVNTLGVAVAGQTQSLAPADKLLYALRDVTGTVSSIPLIASSIMSKKLAAGADVIVLDVKIGQGAFMKTLDEARALSSLMVAIGRSFGKKVTAFITRMDEPLGFAIGNRLEVLEAMQTLKGQGPRDLTDLCLELGSYLVYHAGLSDSLRSARDACKAQIDNLQAYETFLELIERQGGTFFDPQESLISTEVIAIKATQAGVVHAIDALALGLSAMQLGAGRVTKEQSIDHEVGLVLNAKVGSQVEEEDVLVYVYTKQPLEHDFIEAVRGCFTLDTAELSLPPLILEVIEH